MPKKRKTKKKLNLNFTEVEIRKLFKKYGSVRVSKEAVVMLDKLLYRQGINIVKNSLIYSASDNKNELRKQDILKATKELIPETSVFVHHFWAYRDNGTCLMSKSFSGLKFPDTLFTGLLMGISNMVSEVTGRSLDYLVMDDLTLHAQGKSSVYMAIVCDTTQKESIAALLTNLLNRFIENYHEILDNQVLNLNIFESFYEIVEDEVASAGMYIPTEIAKIETPILTHKQIENSVLVAALRNEIIKASEQIKQLPIFAPENSEKRSEEEMESIKFGSDRAMDSLDEIEETKEIIKEQRKALEELKNGNSEK